MVQLAERDGRPELASFYLGIVGASQAIPGVLSGLVGGVVADRMDRRTLLVRTRISASIAATVLAALVFTETISLPFVILLSAVSTMTFSFDGPARMALLPSAVSPSALFSGMGLMRASFQLATLLGPLLGGLLIAPLGIGGVLLTVAGMFVLSMAVVLRMLPNPVDEAERRQNFVESFKEGVRFARHDAIVGPLYLFTLALAVLGQSHVALLPAVVHETFRAGAVELSWLAASAGAGALSGSIVAGSLGAVRERGRLLLGAAILTGIAIMLFGLQRDLVVAVGMIAVVGFLSLVVHGTQNNILITVLPDRLRGRLIGLQITLFQAGIPAGTLVFGAAGSLIGVSNAIVLAGSGVLLTGIAALAFSRLREVRAPD